MLSILCLNSDSQICQWFRVLRFPTNNTDRNDIAEILLKVALSTGTSTKQTKKIADLFLNRRIQLEGK